ncbi:hypothetical protein [Neorhizobium sp. NCHU2750]|uniref:hypothetical protein n=1 Tax=Neorhizobium sp. NCHU2750 TaxID=1825976 RepID=UPI000E7316B9|nr:hypothetical protein NCHU2750_50110 [Neorhizobium sp. NCHU2750]
MTLFAMLESQAMQLYVVVIPMTGKMANPIVFGRSYMAFTAVTEPYQRADDVGYAIAEFMSFKGRPYYPIGALANTRIAASRLSAGDVLEADEDNLDLIFRMREAEGGYFFEIVLRSSQGTRYGGWLWGYDVEVTDEIVNGYRVIETIEGSRRWRFEFCDNANHYQSVDPLPIEKIIPDWGKIG